MELLVEDELNRFLAGNYTNTPKCAICSKKICYIIVETKIERFVPTGVGGNPFFFSSSPPQKEKKKKKGKEYRMYYYSTICNTCKPKQKYITDASMNAFVEADCKYGPMCAQCQKEYCFIRIEDGNKYFTKMCSSCLESKKF